MPFSQSAVPVAGDSSRLRRGFELLLFSQELRALLRAGLTVVEAIEALAEQATGAGHQAVYAVLLKRLREGLPLSRALEALPDCFPPLFIASIRSNETSGGLVDALGRYIAYGSQLAALRKKVLSAALYPAILLGVGLLVMAFLLLYLVPRFSTIYQGEHADLPLLSRLLMQWGGLMHQYPAEILIGMAGLVAIAVYAFSRSETRFFLWTQLQRIPMIHEALRQFFLSRLYRTLAMLLHAGIPLAQALTMTKDLLPADMAQGLERTTQQVREGRPLSQTLHSQGLTTPIALRLLRVGERSGELASMMDHCAEFLDEALARWVDTISRVVEPLLMLIIGGFIGLIVILMYLPIFDLASGIGS